MRARAAALLSWAACHPARSGVHAEASHVESREDAQARPPDLTAAPVALVQGANERWLLVNEGWIFYVDPGAGLVRMPKRGGASEVLAPASLVGDPTAIVLAGPTVYVAPARGVYAIDTAVSPPSIKPVGPGKDVGVACLAVGGSLVWFELKKPDVWALGGDVKEQRAQGPARLLTSFRTPSFGCVGADETRAYALAFDETREASGTLVSFGEGGTRRLVSGIVAPPLHLRLAGTRAYWVEAETVRSVATTGGAVTTVVQLPEASLLADFAVDGAGEDGTSRDVFLALHSGIQRVRGSSRVMEPVFPGEAASALAVDGATLTWNAHGTILRAPIPP